MQSPMPKTILLTNTTGVSSAEQDYVYHEFSALSQRRLDLYESVYARLKAEQEREKAGNDAANQSSEEPVDILKELPAIRTVDMKLAKQFLRFFPQYLGAVLEYLRLETAITDTRRDKLRGDVGLRALELALLALCWKLEAAIANDPSLVKKPSGKGGSLMKHDESLPLELLRTPVASTLDAELRAMFKRREVERKSFVPLRMTDMALLALCKRVSAVLTRSAA